MTHVPIRRCVGCGRSAPRSELVRFAAVDGTLVPAPRGPGRGAYTCREQECFATAVARKAFPRALRCGVMIEPALARLYTEEPNG